MNAPYPWLESHWGDLQTRWASGALGHAYLLSGRSGLGKLDLAEAFAGTILCEAEQDLSRPCGQCRGCTLLASGNHPDYRRLSPEDDRAAIVIDQVRDLIAFYTLKSHYLGYKIGIVCPAEAMNTAAANALLKILEEPPPRALLLLISHRPGLLPATVTSRCQRISIAVPPWEAVEGWLSANCATERVSEAIETLALADAPLDIMQQLEAGRISLLNDLIEAMAAMAGRRVLALDAARDFAAVDIQAFIDAVETLVQALVLLRTGHRLPRLRIPHDQLGHLQEIADKLDFKRLFLYLDEVALARSLVLRSSGVRSAEIIENLWFGWARATSMENEA